MRVQTVVAGSGPASKVPSARRMANDLDFIAARLHGRRSRMAEAERLDSLCRVGNPEELFSLFFPESELETVAEFQRLCVQALIAELSEFRAHISGPGADLLDWMLVRFQAENLKVLLRVFITKTAAGNPEDHLVALPKELALDQRRFLAAESLDDFIRLVPKGLLRQSLEEAAEIYRDFPRPFFFEAALDLGYFLGLLARLEKLSGESRETLKPLIYQEVDIYHVSLVARGKFHYGLPPEMLMPLHVAGSRILRAGFESMLHDPELSVSVGRVVGRVVDVAPPERVGGEGAGTIDASAVEALAWTRFYRLANTAFRRSHMGLGAVVGYAGLRRMEVANLITISEGIRSGMAPEMIRGRLIPRSVVEGTHV